MVKVLQGQSLFDIAIQTTGSLEGAFALALANDISLTDELPAGMELQTVEVVNRDIANYYKNKRLTPATGLKKEASNTGIFNKIFNKKFG